MATTRTLFDQELAELKSGVVRMGSMVEQAIAESMRALVDRNNALAKEVIARDQEVNELHRLLRERAFMIMATQQPVALVPGVRSCIRLKIRRKVVLPQPEGPISAVIRRACTASEASSSAWKSR